MKIATFNINGIKARLPALTDWLKEADPDVALLQEIKSVDVAVDVVVANVSGAVVVEISEIDSHRQGELSKVLSFCDILEPAATVASVKARQLEIDWQTEFAGHDRSEISATPFIARHVKVQHPVVVKIPKPDRKARRRAGAAGLLCHIGERPVAVISKEAIGRA